MWLVRKASPALLPHTHLVRRVPDFLQILLQHLFWSFTCGDRVISGATKTETLGMVERRVVSWA